MKRYSKAVTLSAVCFFVVISMHAFARRQAGIYTTVHDYEVNHLSYGSDLGQFKMHFHDFFGNSGSFSVIQNGEKHRLQKSAVYGYRDRDGGIYRFYRNSDYKIVEAGDIYIYTRDRNVTQVKGFVVVHDYFFSVGAEGRVLPLTRENVASVYQTDTIFIEKLACHMEDITGYDRFHKMFLVNYLYKKAHE